MKPRLLDLFCGAGGASEGYARAGFDVTGVDNVPHKSYPFEFICADALTVDLSGFDVVAASPPCQAYSITKHSHSKQHPDLLPETRRLLREWGGTYIIENVPGAPMEQAVTLCGSMFDLSATDLDGTELVLRRHRLFESNILLFPPGPCRHDDRQVGGVYGGGSSDRRYAKEIRRGGYTPRAEIRRGGYTPRAEIRRGGYTPRAEIRRELMGIDWMTQDDLNQAIPPAYTEYLGAQLLDHLVHPRSRRQRELGVISTG